MYVVAVMSATTTMILVEPESVYAARQRMPKPLPPAVAATQKPPSRQAVPHRLPNDNFSTELVFEILKNNDGGPMPITSVVNESRKWFKFANNRERVEHKKMMFKIIGRLIRTCRLDRYQRKHVILPSSDAKRQAYLAKAAAPIYLPPPCV